ncbi:MAG TPA: ABC transporter ATP-binding protein [Aliidongia sp.]|nr:ABC transporter ATP-binding protein [Aliidongia sp.]
MSLTVEIRRKQIGGRAVLEDLRFDVEDGEILALVGPSGCGKSTLLKLVGGLDAEFDGRLDWHGPQPRIGTVFQEPRLLPWRSVRDNLRLVLPPDADPTPLDRLLDQVGLGEVRDRWASQLSLGMARRLSLARALAIEPGLLLLDEPFVSLDEAMAESARALLLSLWRRHPVAVLLVTHDLAEAGALADRVLLLSEGPARVVASYAVPPDRRRAGHEAALGTAAALRLLRDGAG